MSAKTRIGVYLHKKPNGDVFYVGKGFEYRARSLYYRDRNPWHAKVVAKYGRANILITFIQCSNEELALRIESELIRIHKSEGSPLVNISTGGQGSTGTKHTENALVKISTRSRQLMGDPVWKKWWMEQFTAVVKSDSHRQRMRIIAKETHNRPDVRVIKSEAMRDVWANQNHREKISKSIKLAYESPEARQKLSVAAKKSCERDEVRRFKRDAANQFWKEGRVWVTDGVKNKRVTPADLPSYLSNNWREGVTRVQGEVWVCNSKELRRIHNSKLTEYLSNGYIQGRIYKCDTP
jgi:hypothetical protein